MFFFSQLNSQLNNRYKSTDIKVFRLFSVVCCTDIWKPTNFLFKVRPMMWIFTIFYGLPLGFCDRLGYTVLLVLNQNEVIGFLRWSWTDMNYSTGSRWDTLIINYMFPVRSIQSFSLLFVVEYLYFILNPFYRNGFLKPSQ